MLCEIYNTLNLLEREFVYKKYKFSGGLKDDTKMDKILCSK